MRKNSALRAGVRVGSRLASASGVDGQGRSCTLPVKPVERAEQTVYRGPL